MLLCPLCGPLSPGPSLSVTHPLALGSRSSPKVMGEVTVPREGQLSCLGGLFPGTAAGSQAVPWACTQCTHPISSNPMAWVPLPPHFTDEAGVQQRQKIVQCSRSILELNLTLRLDLSLKPYGRRFWLLPAWGRGGCLRAQRASC